jgi:hypothetical protein
VKNEINKRIFMKSDKMSDLAETQFITLTSKGLKNIQWSNYENDFTFEVGEKHYDCPSFVAEFISPRISKLRQTDNTIQSFQITTSDPTDNFAKVLSLGFGSSVCFAFHNSSFIQSICIELESREIYEEFMKNEEEPLTLDNIVSRLQSQEKLNCLKESDIEFAAFHFISLESSIFDLNCNLLSRLLKHQSLRLRNEDWLYETILSATKRNCEYSILFEDIRYEYLSKSSIESFIDFICESFDTLTVSIWQSLRNRIVCGFSPSPSFSSFSSPNPRYLDQDFPFGQDSPFDGIISFLIRSQSGNIDDQSLFCVKSSSVYSDRVTKNVIDFASSTYAQTSSEMNSWICYDFKDKRVQISHYSLRSRSDYDGYHPMNWTIEGSKDSETWIELDRRDDCRDLVGLNRSSTFSTHESEFVRYIRLRRICRQERFKALKLIQWGGLERRCSESGIVNFMSTVMRPGRYDFFDGRVATVYSIGIGDYHFE